METCTDIQLPEMISALAHSSTVQYDIQQIPEKYIKDEHALIMAKCTSITSDSASGSRIIHTTPYYFIRISNKQLYLTLWSKIHLIIA